MKAILLFDYDCHSSPKHVVTEGTLIHYTFLHVDQIKEKKISF